MLKSAPLIHSCKDACSCWAVNDRKRMFRDNLRGTSNTTPILLSQEGHLGVTISPEREIADYEFSGTQAGVLLFALVLVNLS